MMANRRFLTLVMFLALSWPFQAVYANMMIGGETHYVVKKGDSLELIGALFGVHWKNIARDNGLEMNKLPEEDTRLTINTRKIVPKVVDNGIIVNLPDRTLYYFKDRRLTAIPIGVGKVVRDISENWQTSTGSFRIIRKRENPTWYVPESIQMEAALKGKPVEESVPPGPENPLGRYALVTSIPGILIHETIYPKSVYRYRSHGCIRVLPEDMEKLFPSVDVGTRGEIIYEPVKVAVADNGRVFLEVRSDVYKRLGSLRDHTRKLIEENGLSESVDWKRVERVVRRESGIAEDVSPSLKEEKKAAPNSGPSFAQRFRHLLKSLWQ
jgi:L,D-transpeptidase ErfK/SrfK